MNRKGIAALGGSLMLLATLAAVVGAHTTTLSSTIPQQTTALGSNVQSGANIQSGLNVQSGLDVQSGPNVQVNDGGPDAVEGHVMAESAESDN